MSYKILLYLCFEILFYQYVQSKIVFNINHNNIQNIFDLVNKNENEDIEFVFSEKLYIFPSVEFELNNITAKNNIHFKGNQNKTVLDFINNGNGLNIFINDCKGQNITFENLIFKNYHPYNPSNNLFHIEIYGSDNYRINFTNCVFENNEELINIKYTIVKRTQNFYNVVFEKCIFR